MQTPLFPPAPGVRSSTKEEDSPSSEEGLESLPKTSFFPGITGVSASLATGELARQAKGQSGGSPSEVQSPPR